MIAPTPLRPPEPAVAALVPVPAVVLPPASDRSFRRWLAAATLLLAILTVVAAWSADSFQRTVQHTDHSQEIITHAQSFSSSLRAAESSQRGYLLTGVPSYLSSFGQNVSNAEQQHAWLLANTTEEARQQARVRQLSAPMHEKLNELQTTVRLRQGGDIEGARRIVLTDRGKDLMDRCESLVREIIAEEALLLEQNGRQRRWAMVQVTVVSFLGLLTAVGGVLALRRRLRRGVEREAQLSDRLQEAQQQIQQQFSEIQALYQTAPTALAFLDENLRFIRVNEHWTLMSGVPMSACIGSQVQETIPLLAPQLDPLLNACILSSSALLNQEISGRTAAHPEAERTWLVSCRLIQGPLRGVAVSMQDITEQRRMQQEVRENESRLRLTQSVSGLGNWDWNLSTNEITASAEHAYLYGFSPESAPRDADAWNANIYRDDLPRVEESFSQALRTGEPFEHEFRVAAPNGRLRWLLSKGQVLSHQNGLWQRILGIALDVTERREAENERVKLVALLQRSPDCIGFATLEGRVQFLNQAGYRMLGLVDTAEAEQTPLLEYFEAQDRSRWDNEILPYILCGGVWEGDICLHNFAENRAVRVDMRAFAVFDSAGGLLGVAHVSRDVTERRQIEDELRLSQERLSLAQRAAGIGTWEWYPQLRVSKWSDECFELFGIARQSADWQTRWRESIQEEDRGILDPAVERCLAYGSADYQYRYQHPEKGLRWIYSTLHCVPSLSTPEIRVLGVSFDITERHYAEEALRSLVAGTAAVTGAAFFSKVVENLAVALGVRYAIVSEFIQPDRLRTLALWADSKLAPNFEYGTAQTPCKTVVEERRMLFVPDKLTSQFPDNATLQKLGAESYLGVPLIGTSGECIGNLCVMHDQTLGHFETAQSLLSVFAARAAAELERHRVEQELQRSQAQFLQAQKMEAVGRLAGGVAHDFNNLLTVILGYTGLLQESLEHDPELGPAVLEVQRAGERAAGLTNQLLTFSRQRTAQVQALELNNVVTGVHQMLRRLLGEDVEFLVLLAPDKLMVLADQIQLEQVLMNLAVNARDAMPRGGRLVISTHRVVAAELEEPLSYPAVHVAELRVVDTGSGMDDATRARLFEPFFTTKDAGKGTGLGLATVYGIVQGCGGDIQVRSRIGEGSTFRIFFPLTDSRLLPTGPARAPFRGGITGSVLVVEDDASVRDLTSSLLKHAGHRVTTAAHPHEALALLEAQPGACEVVVSDIIMPLMSGPELIEKMRQRQPLLPVVYLSGYGNHDLLAVAAADQRARVLAKPYRTEALLSAVAEQLSAARNSRVAG